MAATRDLGGSTAVATLVSANHRDRITATGVDLLLVAVLGSGALALTGSVDPSLRLGLLLFAVGVPTLLVEGVVGRSPGKAGLRLRHAQPDADGPALTLPQAVGRYVLKWLVPVALVSVGLVLAAVAWWVALYLPALGPAGRAAHDRLTRTVVLGPTERQRAEGA